MAAPIWGKAGEWVLYKDVVPGSWVEGDNVTPVTPPTPAITNN